MQTGNQNDGLKGKAREQARQRRRYIATSTGREFGARLAAHFFANFDVEVGTRVSGYWPIAHEADVEPLLIQLSEKDCTCLLPVVAARDSALVFREWQPGDDLVQSDLGVSEPGVDKPVGIPDILLIPLLAFDDQGNRLGYGGGYYDRTLLDLRAERDITAIGIAFAGQEVETVPNGSFDQCLDWVITEEGARELIPKID